MFVVVINEFAQDSLELAPMKNQHPIEALAWNGAYELLGERIRTRGLKGARMIQDPSARNTSSKLVLNLVSRSRIKL